MCFCLADINVLTYLLTYNAACIKHEREVEISSCNLICRQINRDKSLKAFGPVLLSVEAGSETNRTSKRTARRPLRHAALSDN